MEANMVDAEYMKEIERARRDLRAIIYSRNAAPHMLRLAWIDAATYDPKTKTGGPNGSIRNLKEEMDNESTLKIAADFCEEVKAKHPKITYADLYQLAGIVAVEVTGGPTIDFVPGRKDSLKLPEQSRLWIIGEGAESLKEVFSPTGLSNKDIVALFGGQTLIFVHALGRNLSENIPGFECPWTRKPLQFDNHIFKELLLEKGSEEVLKVPGDEKYLVEDPEFRQYMELYAQDEEAFLVDYAASHKKLSELGFTPPKHSEQGSTPPKLKEGEVDPSSTSPSFSFKLAVQNNRVLAQVDVAVGLLLGFGVAIACMWIFGYFCGINRRVM